MNQVLKNRLVGAAVLVVVGVLIPATLVWWAQPDDSLANGEVRVYEINEQGEAVPVDEAGSKDQKTSAAGQSLSSESASDHDTQQTAERSAAGPEETDASGETVTTEPEAQARATPEPEPESKPDPEPQQPEQPEFGADASASATTSASGESRPEDGWVVQIGSFSKAANARRMKSDVSDDYDAFIASGTVSGTRYHRVRVGPYDSEEAAHAAARRLGDTGYTTQVQRGE